MFTLILVAPSLLVAAGPWTFTPLTARALSGWGICLGLLLLSMARRERLAPRPPGDADADHPGPGAAGAVPRFGAEVRWSNPWLLAFLADVALLAALAAALRLDLPFTVAGPRRSPPGGRGGGVRAA